MDRLEFLKKVFKTQFLDSIIKSSDDGAVKRYVEQKRKRNLLLLIFLQKEIKKIPKNENYINLAVEILPDDIFFSQFRMGKNCFLKLERELNIEFAPNIGRPQMPAKKALYITLLFLSTQNSYREISDRFDISKSTAHGIVMRVCKKLTSLSSKYVKWPSAEEHLKIVSEFNKKNSLPNVAGAVDSVHIRISTPKYDPSSYNNRKGYSSIIMQGICDSKFQFIDVFIGWPGRAHDAFVWKNSGIGKALKDGHVILPNNSYLVGDSSYPLQKYLLIPYKDIGNLTSQQEKYNTYLSSQRVCIEQAFRILKAKFQILEYCIKLNDIKNVKYIIAACVVLHNFILQNDSHNDNVNINYEDNENDEINECIPSNEEADTNAKLKRNLICEAL